MFRTASTLVMTILIFALPMKGMAAVSPQPAGQKADKADKVEKVLSFTEWKTDKISLSTDRIRNLTSQYTELRRLNPRAASLLRLQQELNQEHWNLEVARDLSPRDYLLLYVKVKGNNSKLKVQQIAALLSPEEVGQFLESYIEVIGRPGQPASYSSGYPKSRQGNQGVQAQ